MNEVNCFDESYTLRSDITPAMKQKMKLMTAKYQQSFVK